MRLHPISVDAATCERIATDAAMLYRRIGGVEYCWSKSVVELTDAEIDLVRTATGELYRLWLAAVGHVIDGRRFDLLPALPGWMVDHVVASWDAADELPSMLWRFDLALVVDDAGTVCGVKALEANAQTPTSFPESTAWQWGLVQAAMPGAQQWNAGYERMVEAWAERRPYLEPDDDGGITVHFAWSNGDVVGEDFGNVANHAAAAEEAGLRAVLVAIEEVELWDSSNQQVVDFAAATAAGTRYVVEGRPVRNLAMLYAWEHAMTEPGGRLLIEHMTRRDLVVLEPLWKLVATSKALLPVLWELFPDHPLLLPAYADGPRDLTDWVRKPVWGREGQNVEIRRGGEVVASADGDYDGSGNIWQAYTPLPALFDASMDRELTFVAGAWVIGDEPAGLGFRGDGLITTNASTFYSHVIAPPAT